MKRKQMPRAAFRVDPERHIRLDRPYGPNGPRTMPLHLPGEAVVYVVWPDGRAGLVTFPENANVVIAVEEGKTL